MLVATFSVIQSMASPRACALARGLHLGAILAMAGADDEPHARATCNREHTGLLAPPACVYVVAKRRRSGRSRDWLFVLPLLTIILESVHCAINFGHHPWMAGHFCWSAWFFALGLDRPQVAAERCAGSETKGEQAARLRRVPGRFILLCVDCHILLPFSQENVMPWSPWCAGTRIGMPHLSWKAAGPRSGSDALRLQESFDRRVVVVDKPVGGLVFLNPFLLTASASGVRGSFVGRSSRYRMVPCGG